MSWTHERARIAGLSRCVKNGERRPDDPDLAEAKLNLRAERLAHYVSKELAKSPPLTREQLDRIAGLLQPPIGVS